METGLATQSELVTLIGRTALSDRSAFKALYDETAPHIYALLLRMLRRRDIAEEILQDTYLKVWQRASDYHSERGQVLTWLASIARYRALDLIRGRSLSNSEGDDTHGLPSDSDNPGSGIELDGDRLKLNTCLETLSADQRQSIALAFYRGFTHEEMAMNLDVPLGTVKSWIRRGLKSLKECMQR